MKGNSNTVIIILLVVVIILLLLAFGTFILANLEALKNHIVIEWR